MASGSTFLGRLARKTVRGLVRLYYPNIEVTGGERLPATGPLLLAANHPNSLMDPVLVGIAARRPVRYLAKAPLFQVPLFGHVLHALGMLPAYRRSDDPALTKRNVESLALAAAHLKRGEAVGIFPEGKSHDAPRLEAMKTGAARIAIQAVRDGALGLKLVPIGLNYERKELFRSAVWIRVGEPIDVNAWLAAHEGDDRQAARDLSAEIDRRLKELVVHLDDDSLEPILRDLEVLLPPPRESARNPFAWLRQRKRLADAINHFRRADPARADAMAALIQQNRSRLEAAGLSARSTVLRWRGWRLTLRLLGEAVLMDLGFVVVLVGTLHHLVPFVLTRLAARAVQAPGRTTTALARFGLGVPIYGAWYAFHAWWIASYFLPWVAWAWLLPMPFAGLLALSYWRRVKRTSSAWWRDLALACQPSRLKGLRAEHDELRSRLREMAEEFAKERPPEPLPLNTFSWRRLAWRTARWCAVGVAVFLAVAWLRTNLREDRLAEFDAPAPQLGRLSTGGLAAALDTDEWTLTELLGSLSQLETRAARLKAEFGTGQRSYYAQADDDAIRQAMLSYLSCRTTLLGLVWKYQRHAEVADERLRWRAFLASYAAASVLSDSSLKLVTLFAPHPEAVRKLNEADAAWELPPGVFDMVKRNLLQALTREFMEQSLARSREPAPLPAVPRGHSPARAVAAGIDGDVDRGPPHRAIQGSGPHGEGPGLSRPSLRFNLARQHPVPQAARRATPDSISPTRRAARETQAGGHPHRAPELVPLARVHARLLGARGALRRHDQRPRSAWFGPRPAPR
jgi:1-acyl-sn-glycerol-3-phosphate acyltransferase